MRNRWVAVFGHVIWTGSAVEPVTNTEFLAVRGNAHVEQKHVLVLSRAPEQRHDQ